MAASSVPNEITVDAVGYSDHLTLPAGEHILIANAGSWGSVFLQVGDGDEYWADAKDQDGNKIEFTEDDSAKVPGGVSYRLRCVTIPEEVGVKALRVPATA